MLQQLLRRVPLFCYHDVKIKEPFPQPRHSACSACSGKTFKRLGLLCYNFENEAEEIRVFSIYLVAPISSPG